MSNPKKWILLPLLSVGLVLILFVYTGHAARLKDIRVGEYKDFTRIVFELDAPAEPEKIEQRSNTQLAVDFENTSADLIRKIPMYRSPHVNDVQIWEKGNGLTVLLIFDFNGFSHESFSLPDPTRIVLDIHPTPNAPDAGADSPPGGTPDSVNGSSQSAPAGRAAPADVPDETPISEKSASQISEPPPGEAPKPPVSVDQVPSPATPPTSAARSSGARPGRLQFYLAIFLVAITIVILALLLLMLLSRHRWIGDKSHLTAVEDSESSKNI